MNYLMLHYPYLLSDCVLSTYYVQEALFLHHYYQKKKKWGCEIMGIKVSQLHYQQVRRLANFLT